MLKTAMTVIVGMGIACSAANAAIYTNATTLNFVVSDAMDPLYTAFVPAFDLTKGTLNSTTFRLTGQAQDTASFYQNTPPQTGSFLNAIQFNNSPLTTLSTTAISPSSFVSSTTLQNNFGVDASATYGSSYQAAPGSKLDLVIDLSSAIQPVTCCYYTQIQFGGTLLTTFDYTPPSAVPEPMSLSLLLSAVVGLGLSRHRHRVAPLA